MPRPKFARASPTMVDQMFRVNGTRHTPRHSLFRVARMGLLSAFLTETDVDSLDEAPYRKYPQTRLSLRQVAPPCEMTLLSKEVTNAMNVLHNDLLVTPKRYRCERANMRGKIADAYHVGQNCMLDLVHNIMLNHFREEYEAYDAEGEPHYLLEE